MPSVVSSSSVVCWGSSDMRSICTSGWDCHLGGQHQHCRWLPGHRTNAPNVPVEDNSRTSKAERIRMSPSGRSHSVHLEFGGLPTKKPHGGKHLWLDRNDHCHRRHIAVVAGTNDTFGGKLIGGANWAISIGTAVGGGATGAHMARTVAMTAMPQLVALLGSFVGLATFWLVFPPTFTVYTAHRRHRPSA